MLWRSFSFLRSLLFCSIWYLVGYLAIGGSVAHDSGMAVALDNGLALVPPMGWNAWNAFGQGINQSLVMQAANQVMELGLDQLGYRYINIDDCWSAPNRTNNTLVGNPLRFPSGMKWMGDYLHHRGLKFGIYSSAGVQTCAGFPGSLGFESVDAQTFADWGVDYLKYDNCGNLGLHNLDRFVAMRNALNATGRSIFYSICQWGHETPWQWAPAVGNAWRADGDMRASWRSIKTSFQDTFRHVEKAKPGAWLDPDMLQVGNGKLNEEENKSHFSLWALLKAPLLLGNDLMQVTPPLWNIISNRDLIDWHQNPSTTPIRFVHGQKNDDGEDEFTIYASTIMATTMAATVTTRIQKQAVKEDISQHERAAGTHYTVESITMAIFLNWGEFPQPAQTLNLAQILGLVPFPNQAVTIQDLWTNQVVTTTTPAISITTPGGRVASENNASSSFFSYEDLKQVRIPELIKHGCIVYRFVLLTQTPTAAMMTTPTNHSR